MKVAGIALTVFGVLTVVGGLINAFAKYDLNPSHDLSKFFVGFGVSVLMLLGGVAMIIKSGSKR